MFQIINWTFDEKLIIFGKTKTNQCVHYTLTGFVLPLYVKIEQLSSSQINFLYEELYQFGVKIKRVNKLPYEKSITIDENGDLHRPTRRFIRIESPSKRVFYQVKSCLVNLKSDKSRFCRIGAMVSFPEGVEMFNSSINLTILIFMENPSLK